MCETINYQLFTELSSAITEKYNHYFNLLAELKKCSLIKFFNKKSCTIR